MLAVTRRFLQSKNRLPPNTRCGCPNSPRPSTRWFQSSTVVLRSSSSTSHPTETRATCNEQNTEEHGHLSGGGHATKPTEVTGKHEIDGEPIRRPSQPGYASFYGSAANRASRNRRVPENVQFKIPEWFLHHSVRLASKPADRLVEHALSCSVVLGVGTEKPRLLLSADVALRDLGTVGKRLVQTFTGDSLPTQFESILDSNTHYDFSEAPVNHGGYGDNVAVAVEEMHLPLMIAAEIKANAAAYLSSAKSSIAELFPVAKTNILLHCPHDGGTKYLDKVVEDVADGLHADIIRLDAQDISELTSYFSGILKDSEVGLAQMLGYDTHRHFTAEEEKEDDDEDDDDSFIGGWMSQEEPSDSVHPSREIFTWPNHQVSAMARTSKAVPLAVFASDGRDTVKPPLPYQLEPVNRFQYTKRHDGSSRTESEASQHSTKPRSGKVGLTALLEELLDASVAKKRALESRRDAQKCTDLKSSGLSHGVISNARFAESTESKILLEVPLLSIAGTNSETRLFLQVQEPRTLQDHAPECSKVSTVAQRTIIHVRDFKEMNATATGGYMLKQLAELVNARRKEGKKIMIIGTTSSAELVPSPSKDAIESLQGEEIEDVMSRTIVAPFAAAAAASSPLRRPELNTEPSSGGKMAWRGAEQERTLEINVRHMRIMMRRLDPLTDNHAHLKASVEPFLTPTNAALLRSRVLPFDHVHRIMLTAYGLCVQQSHDARLNFAHVDTAMLLLWYSDEAKFEWAQSADSDSAGHKKGLASDDLGNRIQAIEKTCNTHERRLIPGVIRPEDIGVSFDHVHAPAETIAALKDLTSLSLMRPDAFSYGVLATDKIPGLLLYGAPGTGKSLLVKALAKEGSATVLEVSGAEINDMYVGEGEKNVKAIFTLARKLAPCVVFIDEADAILSQRSGATNRVAHREMINQFLREWDGMGNMNVFVMIATNRPFDLDDAVLRRLPRKLLVDLPLEADREAILRIHLRDETIEPSVNLAHLAARTPLYSGSDLKNVAVAAALAAVRDENADAKQARHAGATNFQFPKRRTLKPHHFDSAIKQISASISEDMNSVAAIKKFDQKYGDRGGHRNSSIWGFESAEKKELDIARVRP